VFCDTVYCTVGEVGTTSFYAIIILVSSYGHNMVGSWHVGRGGGEKVEYSVSDPDSCGSGSGTFPGPDPDPGSRYMQLKIILFYFIYLF